MDLVYHVLKSPLISSDQNVLRSRKKWDLRFTQKLCKIRKSNWVSRHQDDTDAIINSNIGLTESQRYFVCNCIILYILNRKVSVLIRKLFFRTAALLTAVLILMTGTGLGEGVLLIPPTPEAPEGIFMGRPTPAPTPEPPDVVVNNARTPRDIPDFHFPKDAKLFEVWFPNIRDADEAILMYDGQVWMIDCGDERAATRGVPLLKQLGIEKIEILFNSHLHHDHINGLAITDDTAKVGEVRICFPPDLTESGLKLIQTAEDRNIPIKEYKDGDTFFMGDGAVKLLFLKNDESYLDMNNQSAQTLITYGERSILFMADMETPGQKAMIDRIGGGLLKCDVVKYPHHAKHDMYTPFYEAMDAKLAIVTSVEGRGDAGQLAIDYRGLPAVYTASSSSFTHLVTDGHYWLCEKVAIK